MKTLAEKLSSVHQQLSMSWQELMKEVHKYNLEQQKRQREVSKQLMNYIPFRIIKNDLVLLFLLKTKRTLFLRSSKNEKNILVSFLHSSKNKALVLKVAHRQVQGGTLAPPGFCFSILLHYSCTESDTRDDVSLFLQNEIRQKVLLVFLK